MEIRDITNFYNILAQKLTWKLLWYTTKIIKSRTDGMFHIINSCLVVGVRSESFYLGFHLQTYSR